MTKTVKEVTIRKILKDSIAQVEIIQNNDETVCVEVNFTDGNKSVIEIKKYIPYEDSATMVYEIANEVAGEHLNNDDLEFIYRPYIKGWVSCFYFLKYFTNIDTEKTKPELLNKFFLSPNSVWSMIQEISEGISQLSSILLDTNDLIEYNKALYINTQTQQIRALERRLMETIEGFNNISTVLSAIGENYSHMDKETTEKLVENLNKLASIDQNEMAAKVATYIEAGRGEEEKPKTRKPRAKKEKVVNIDAEQNS